MISCNREQDVDLNKQLSLFMSSRETKDDDDDDGDDEQLCLLYTEKDKCYKMVQQRLNFSYQW